MNGLALRYSIVDVFTKKRFSGNPVAVIHHADSLKRSQMQLIAREFGFSETTFVLPPRDERSSARVRIFTPFDEIPFAGHPSIGTGFVIALRRTASEPRSREEFVLDEPGGLIPVRLLFDGRAVVGASIRAPQRVEVLGSVDRDLITKCLGSSAGSVRVDRIEPCVASIGLPFAFVEVADIDVLASLEPNITAFKEARDRGPATVDGFSICAFVLTRQSGPEAYLRSRVFSPLGHPPEDPATGSASGALAALLTQAAKGLANKFTIEQGVEIRRPSKIIVETLGEDAPPRITGHCVLVSNGTLHL